jgi:hypothetical protein
VTENVFWQVANPILHFLILLKQWRKVGCRESFELFRKSEMLKEEKAMEMKSSLTHCLVQGIEEGKIVDGWKARKPKYVPPFVSAEQ